MKLIGKVVWKEMQDISEERKQKPYEFLPTNPRSHSPEEETSQESHET